MNDLHLRFAQQQGGSEVSKPYTTAVVPLREFKSKLPASNISDIEACLDALYGLLLLRLRKKNIQQGNRSGDGDIQQNAGLFI